MTFVNVQYDVGFEITSNVPALTGVLASDVLIAFAAADNGSRAPTVVPAGFTEIADSGGSTRLKVYVAAGSANAATTWTWNTSQWSRVVIVAYRDVVAPTGAGTATLNSTPGTTIVAPSVTTANAAATLLTFTGCSTSDIAAPAGMTIRAETTGSAGFLLADEPRPTAGATGTRTFTTPASSLMTVAAVKLEPVAGPADTTAPTVTLANPTPAGQTVGYEHLSGTVTLSATASDSVGVTKVEFLVDGTLLSTDTGAPYTASWNTTTARAGAHTLTAKAYDAAGNVGSSNTVTAIVNNAGRWVGPSTPAYLRATAPVPAHVWDYQTGDFTQWEEIHSGRAAQTAIVTTPAREGYPDTARFIVAPGDRASFDALDVERGEVMTTEALTGSPAEGAEQWFAWSTWFPTGFQMGPDTLFLTYTQWHHSGSTGNPNIMFLASRETDPKILLTVRGGAVSSPPSFDQTWTLTPSPIQRDAWLDHVVYIKWSSDPAVGRVGVWLNGAELLSPTAMPTLFTGQSAYLKQGIYRGNTTRTHTLYHTGTRRGPTRDSVTL